MDPKNVFLEAQGVLSRFLDSPDNFQKIEDAAGLITAALKHGSKVVSCGNGGSMCDAIHFAEELSGKFRNDRKPLAAISISDPGHISCVANDYGYEYVFSRYVDAVCKKGDVLLAISTSGNSPNIIRAAESANGIGMKVIGLTGKDGGKLAGLCDVEIRAPQSEYADRAQEIHIKVIHALIGLVESGV